MTPIENIISFFTNIPKWVKCYPCAPKFMNLSVTFAKFVTKFANLVAEPQCVRASSFGDVDRITAVPPEPESFDLSQYANRTSNQTAIASNGRSTTNGKLEDRICWTDSTFIVFKLKYLNNFGEETKSDAAKCRRNGEFAINWSFAYAFSVEK